MIRVPVIFLGLGKVGRALLQQVLSSRTTLAHRLGLQLVPAGLTDSQAGLFSRVGFSEDVLAQALRAKANGQSLSTLEESRSPNLLSEYLTPVSIIVDLTASSKTRALLKNALDSGSGVVLANKQPISGPLSEARMFLEHPSVRCEATVGAGLPVMATLRTLLNTGDQVNSIEGCLSGTLGFLCTELEQRVSYSSAITKARALGFTEPDPREDLSGRDVARKAIIMARTAGWALEMNNLTVEALYPEALSDATVEEFLSACSSQDQTHALRVQKAQEDGRVLRYVARVGADGGTVGLQAVERNSLLGALRGPGNFIALHTARYDPEPLVISGPGAGPEVTAAGILGDIVDLALHRASRAEN